MFVIRPIEPDDRGEILALADRLTVGVAEWRPPELVLRAVRGWVSAAVEHAASGAADATVLVAVEDARVAGFVSVGEDRHWSGETDAYIGELVVHPDREGRGVGSALVRAAERWAAARGLARVRLSTGAANVAALRLYDDLGYRREDVTLSRGLERL
ncbi:GNAT family N-acetyltransferase [Flexivirga caeni]|uniref:GNAT family N-acetyltransferase n=1 Tax=Flexivirga caeni TaxID=2294115 RepID=A0A3M9M447_9MICO|nr:GNAT family N-acetyltransferase [Flexivirga caeni]RNI20282.1 GNAT family N-acetyltransferase [Flexivirga caeni]